ncbi:MAG TPA: helix-turn-helix transcriptional regulator [Pseudonocardiaceae bacterium]|nr:helix-turn-helix transcriptional regulator [Pseudonocardiaceae bacterium]
MRTELTCREDEVLHLVISGLSNDEIADRLEISRRTVEAHLRTLFRKTGATRRAQLAALYRDQAAAATGPSTTAPLGADPAPAEQQRQELADCERQLQVYAAAVRGLIDRQFPLFEERVDVTVVVGEQDGQDTVVERRWTRPRPYLVYRILAPIVTSSGTAFDLDELALACQVDGQDTHVDAYPVRDANGRPLVMILFQPGLQGETEWVLRYRSPKLWNPLRTSGRDTLTWATATLDQRHPPATSALTVHVVFPAAWTDVQLIEQSNLGVIHTERLPTGQAQLTWQHETPDAGSYHWVLRGRPGT